MRATQGESRSPLVWLNLVCLDAPLVAIAWQGLFARAFHLPLGWNERGALFFTAWSIYLTDRWFDPRSTEQLTAQSLRQVFCARHRQLWIVLVAFALACDLFLISQLNRRTIVSGTIVGLLALAYLLANARRGSWRVFPIKELSIGTLFALGTVVVPLHLAAPAPLLVALALFAALCALNCICIAIWERDIDMAQQKQTIATRWPQFGKMVALPCVGIALVATLLLITMSGERRLFGAIATSAALLALVHLSGRRIQRDARTALADLVLLVPAAAFLT